MLSLAVMRKDLLKMGQSKLFAVLFGLFTLGHLAMSIVICVHARRLNNQEYQDLGVFNYKFDPIHARRSPANPLNVVGNGATKAINAATQAAAKVTSAVAAIETKVASALDNVKVELHVGTKFVTVMAGSETVQLFPPKSTARTKLELPNLPLDLSDSVDGILKKFQAVASISLETVTNILIGFSFFSSVAYLCLAIKQWIPPRNGFGGFGWAALIVAGVLLNGVACLLFYVTYRFLEGVSSFAHQKLDGDSGPAVKMSLQTFQLSAVQCALSALLVLLVQRLNEPFSKRASKFIAKLRAMFVSAWQRWMKGRLWSGLERSKPGIRQEKPSFDAAGERERRPSSTSSTINRSSPTVTDPQPIASDKPEKAT